MELNDKYWEKRYLEHRTPWDIGSSAPALTEYLEQQSRELKILIPGAGRAYEAEWLVKNGFKDVSVIDLSAQAIKEAKDRFKESDTVKWFVQDFFEHEGQYDLIIEQTFFCALNPELRDAYVAKMKALLNKGGRLMGVLFNFPLSESGPPFGGSEKEYRRRFEAEFEILTLAPAYNSIKPRAGREIFIELKA